MATGQPSSAYLMLYGQGWTQRWQIAEGALAAIEDEIGRVGQDQTGYLTILDPGSGRPTTLVVAWRQVAAAVVLGAENNGNVDTDVTGPYR
jgi:hypothetical protein